MLSLGGPTTGLEGWVRLTVLVVAAAIALVLLARGQVITDLGGNVVLWQIVRALDNRSS
jgi:hypothetical protein